MADKPDKEKQETFEDIAARAGKAVAKVEDLSKKLVKRANGFTPTNPKDSFTDPEKKEAKQLRDELQKALDAARDAKNDIAGAAAAAKKFKDARKGIEDAEKSFDEAEDALDAYDKAPKPGDKADKLKEAAKKINDDMASLKDALDAIT